MIKQLLFDLDNTLYSAQYGLEKNVSRRIIAYLAQYLGLPPEEAAQRRRERVPCYGTTLEWLLAEEGFTEIDAYFAAIHPEDEADTLGPDPALRDFLESLPLPKAIFTNSPMEHAVRILDKLQIRDLFPRIFDIRGNDFLGKPRAEAFYRVLDALGTGPENTLFVDDYPQYITGYLAIGGKGLLLDEEDKHRDFPHQRIRDLRELRDFLA
ncbi:MAG: HAD-IA family hydrolase [Treponema sp.]|jgi:putative hydrolase of the HAD superfamily|nr:HAD-IA family hydrolase [Treponema sp.]